MAWPRPANGLGKGGVTLETLAAVAGDSDSLLA